MLAATLTQIETRQHTGGQKSEPDNKWSNDPEQHNIPSAEADPRRRLLPVAFTGSERESVGRCRLALLQLSLGKPPVQRRLWSPIWSGTRAGTERLDEKRSLRETNEKRRGEVRNDGCVVAASAASSGIMMIPCLHKSNLIAHFFPPILSRTPSRFPDNYS